MVRPSRSTGRASRPPAARSSRSASASAAPRPWCSATPEPKTSPRSKHDGSIHGSATLHALLATDGGTDVDCRASAHACELRIGSFFGGFDTVVAPISFDPDAPARPLATIAVDPSSGLVDGQPVVVTGHGFDPSSRVGVVECASNASVAGCPGSTTILTSPSGDFEVTVDVRAQIWGGVVLDCRDASVRCTMQGYAYSDDGDTRPQAPLAFAPDGPLLPPPTLEATPSTGLVDGQVVSLSGVGFAYHYGPAISPLPDDRATNAVIPMQIRVRECPSSHVTDFGRCNDRSDLVDIDSSGALSGTTSVAAVYVSLDGTTIDCRTAPGACSLFAGPGDPINTANARLTFAADPSTEPPSTGPGVLPAAVAPDPIAASPSFAG